MSVVIVDMNEKSLNKNKTFEMSREAEERMLPLYEYIAIAKRCIGRFASPALAHKMLKDEDAISFITDHLIKGTIRWKADGGRTLRSYLNQCAIWSIKRWILNMNVANKHSILSLDHEIDRSSKQNGSSASMYDLVVNKKKEQSYQDNMDNIDDIINQDYLNDNQRQCLRMRFAEGLTLREIGENLNKSKARVEQIINAALEKLRKQYSPLDDK